MELFPASEPISLNREDADLLFFKRVDLGCDPAQLLRQLIKSTDWQREDITVFGKTYPQPRLIAWHGDPGASYTYSGIAHRPRPWTDVLQQLRKRVEALADARFNSVLLNYYRDQHDSMGLHADDEPELGPQPVIASLSLGEERKLHFKHKHRRDLDPWSIALPSGSLLVMRGQTQRHWKHGLRKLTRNCGPRVNLTFRKIITAA